MTTIIMLCLMTFPWLLARASNAHGRGRFDLRAAGAIGLGLLFLFTASGHWFLADGMVQMLPPWVPGRLAIVHATGVLELAIAAGLFHPATRRLAAWAAVAVLILFFPANIHAALVHAPIGGHAQGPAYLLVRAPLQAAIVLWALGVVLGLRYRERRGARAASTHRDPRPAAR